MHIRWRGLELPSTVAADAASAHPHVRQVRRRAVRARLRRRRSATACGAFCSRAWKAARSRKSRCTAPSTNSPRCPGVVEDVTDIVLNVKSLVVKNHSDSTARRARSRRTRPARSPAPTCRPTNRSRSSTKTTSRHADRRRAVRDRNGHRERPRLRAVHRAQPQRAGNRHYSGRRGLQPGAFACATKSRRPASARRRTTTS